MKRSPGQAGNEVQEPLLLLVPKVAAIDLLASPDDSPSFLLMIEDPLDLGCEAFHLIRAEKQHVIGVEIIANAPRLRNDHRFPQRQILEDARRKVDLGENGLKIGDYPQIASSNRVSDDHLRLLTKVVNTVR
jgi:hypothetical protein